MGDDHVLRKRATFGDGGPDRRLDSLTGQRLVVDQHRPVNFYAFPKDPSGGRHTGFSRVLCPSNALELDARLHAPARREHLAIDPNLDSVGPEPVGVVLDLIGAVVLPGQVGVEDLLTDQRGVPAHDPVGE